MFMTGRGFAPRIGGSALPWSLLALAESLVTSLCLARIAFGTFSGSPTPALWLARSLVLLIASLLISLWTVGRIQVLSRDDGTRQHALLLGSSLPFLAAFGLQLVLLQFQPDLAGWLWDYLSTIEPFPTVAVAITLVAVLILKTVIVAASLTRQEDRIRLFGSCSDVVLPMVMLLIGVLQASVYLIPIGNAFLRFWAITDAMTLGVGYPVTLTEPGPMAAGSPPYVYDLALFPAMLWAAFSIFGHNSMAAHLPALFFNAIFPLSAYLLIREATHSRTAGLVFGALISLFPFLRFWVLNLPDPDPVLLTSLCLSAYLYLRALEAPTGTMRWIVAGLSSGMLSLSRPEGVLYAGFLCLGLLLSRPRVKQMALYLLCLTAFLAPMAVVWMVNFGFLWPQNYNRTLRPDYPLENYNILESMGALGFYHRGLGLNAEGALVLLAVCILSVLLGALMMSIKDRRLLAIAIPGIGNTVMILFAHPAIPNSYHFADFFRHASFGIPYLVATAAYGLYHLYGYASRDSRTRWMGYLGLVLLVLVVVREGDILANPTATHRPGADQVLTTYTYLSVEAILEHPFELPSVSYYQKDGVIVAHSTAAKWPDDALDFYAPLDMAFDSRGRPFGYASIVVFILGLSLAVLNDMQAAKKVPS